MWRRFLLALAIFATLILVSIHALGSARLADAVRERLQNFCSTRLEQPVSIGALHIALWPPAVVLEEVHVKAQGADARGLHVHHARVQPRPWPSSRGALVLAALELTGVTGSWPVDLSMALEAATPHGASRPDALGHHEPKSKPWPLDIQRLSITDATFSLTQGNNWVTVAGVTLLMRPASVSGRRITLDVPQLAAYLPNVLPAHGPHVFGLHVQGALVGTLDHPRYLHLETAQVHTTGVTVQARGDIDFVSQPALRLHGDMQAPLFALQTLMGHNTGWEGYVEVTGSIVGAPQSLAWQGELSGANLALGTTRVGDAQAEFRWHDGSLVLPSVAWDMADGGRVTGSAEWDTRGTRPLQASARLHNMAVPEFLAVAGIPNAWIRQTLQGDIHAAGTTHPWDMRLSFDVGSENFAALDNAYTLKRAKPVLAIASGHIQGSAHVGPTGIALQQVALASGKGRVVVDGLLPFDVSAPIHLRAQTREPLDLQILGKLGQIPFFGMATLDANIVGRYDAPTIDARMTVDDFGFLDYRIGRTHATLHFADLALHMQQLQAEVGGGVLFGAGALQFDHADGVPLDLALTADGVQARAILDIFGVSKAFSRHIQADVHGRVLLSGLAHRLEGVAHVATDRLLVDKVALGPAHLDNSFGGPDTLWEGHLATQPPQGDLRLRMAIHKDDTLALGGEAHDLPMTLVGAWIGNFAQAGTLRAGWDVRGSPTALQGTAYAQVDDYTVGNVTLGTLVIDANIVDGVVVGNGHVGGRAVVWKGSLELNHPLRYKLHAVFTDASVQEFWQVPQDLTLTATGVLDLSGALVGEAMAHGVARISDLHGNWRHASLRNSAPFVLTLEDDIVVIQRGASVPLAGPNLKVALSGRVEGAGPDVKLAMQGDVGLLTGIFPLVTAARGPFSLQLGVHGPWQQLALAGEGNLQQVSLHLGQSDQSIDKLRAHVVFVGRGVEISRGSAQLGDGRLSFSGDTVWPGEGTQPRFNVQASMQRVHLRPMDNLESTMSGDLQLQGPLNDLQLKGKLKLDALRYTARLDLDRLIPKRNAAPLRVSTLSQVPPIHLAVKLHGSNNIIISSSVLEAELQADLMLSGTSERLGLLGNVAPLWARARYRDNTFKVTRATIDFVDEYRIVTEFNVQAETRACNLLADVTVQGNSDGYTVTAQGSDEHGAVDPQDVLSCLQFGLRLHDFAGNQRAPAGVSDALPGSLDALWTVSGMDDKVKKLLPIDVDELRLTSGWSSLSQRTTARILVGKDLGNGVALKYSRSIDEYADQSLSVEYRLAEHTALLGTWVSKRDVPVGDFGVDVRLRWEKP